jgi:teichuronic acid biosynthesis glycosyltransferase TuaC
LPKPERGLRVLFVTNMYPHEGNRASGAFVQQQADHLKKAGHQVDIHHIRGDRSRLQYLASPLDIFNRTRGTTYDVVHAHYGLSGFPALFRCKTPLVITLHGSDALIGRIQPLISRMVCALADAVIVVSKGISARIAGEIIPCGIDLGLFTAHERASARARLGLTPDRRVVLFPFRPDRAVKRYELARAAVDRLGDVNVEMLTVSGVSNEEMPWYYSAADAMILCSASEGSPTSVKEALACNIPVVSTDVGDVREIVEGIEGCEICEADAESLALGLRRVFGRAESRFEGRAAMQRYDQSRVIAAIVRVYERVIQERSSTSAILCS